MYGLEESVHRRSQARRRADGSSSVEPRRRVGRRGAPARRSSGTRRCWRTTTRCPPSRTSPTMSGTRWRCRASRPRRPRRPSCSAACISWPRPPRSSARQDGADPGPARGLLAGRLDHRRRAAAWKAEHPGCRRGVLRQHHRGGQGADRHLLHVLERGRGGRVDTRGPRGAVLPGSVPRRARPPGDGPQEPARLGRRMPRARRHQRRRTGRPGPRASRRRAVRAPRMRLRHLGAVPGGEGAVPADRVKILSTGGMLDAARATPRPTGAGRHRGRHAAPVAQGRTGSRLPCRQRPGVLQVHEDDHSGRAAALPDRGRRRGGRRPRDRSAAPGAACSA